MSNKVDLHTIFQEMEEEKLSMESNDDLFTQVDVKRIQQLTKQKIQSEEKRKTTSIHYKIIKAAAIVGTVLCISGATVYAASNAEIRQSISSLFGISQTEILSIGESISGKDYKLTVHEIASDSHIGIVTVSVEALSEKAKHNFSSDNLIDKFGHIGSIGYSTGELEELREENVKYYSFKFSAHANNHYKDGLTFTFDGISKEIKIPITQTIPLNEMTINAAATDIFPATLTKMKYSELGFTLYGTIDTTKAYEENQNIVIELLDGSSINFYYEKSLPKENTTGSDIEENQQSTASIAIPYGETSSQNTAIAKEDGTISEFDEEWWSGGSYSNDGDGNVVYIHSFSKKMDWSKVKSITINETLIPMQ